MTSGFNHWIIGNLEKSSSGGLLGIKVVVDLRQNKDKRRKIGDNDHRQSLFKFAVKRSKEIVLSLAEKKGIKILSVSIISLLLLVTGKVKSAFFFFRMKLSENVNSYSAMF